MTRSVFLVAWSVLAHQAIAQTLPPTYIAGTKFSTGQDVVPTFDGWILNADGTFTMVFGYMNRNYQEEPAIPAGPDNKVEPGIPDRGQPTYFLPRRHAWVFRVQVPKDWGDQELVWTITAHGRTEKAFGKLVMEQEILERLIMTRGNLNPGLDNPNIPPSVKIAPVGEATVSNPVTLTALVTDDGLPKPLPPPKPRPGALPGQTNSAGGRRRIGLSVTWVEYRGPAKVTFDDTDPIAVKDGQAVNTARFAEPGTYVLRATANDGELSTYSDVTVNVKPGSPAGDER